MHPPSGTRNSFYSVDSAEVRDEFETDVPLSVKSGKQTALFGYGEVDYAEAGGARVSLKSLRPTVNEGMDVHRKAQLRRAWRRYGGLEGVDRLPQSGIT